MKPGVRPRMMMFNETQRPTELAASGANRKRLSGIIRLGIVVSALWFVGLPLVVLLGVRNEYRLPFYGWDTYDDINSPYPRHYQPIMDWDFLLCWWILPVAVPWLVFFVIPKTARWVTDGFQAR